MTLIERAELDRLRQRQIKEYNPILSQLAGIQEEIERVLRTSQLSIEDRVGILNLLHSRFDNLYKTLRFNGGPAIPTGAPVPIIQPIPAGYAPPLPAALGAQGAPAVILAPGPQLLGAPGAAAPFAIQHAPPIGGPLIGNQAERAAAFNEPIQDPLEGGAEADEFPGGGANVSDVSGVHEAKDESGDARLGASFENRSMQTPGIVNFPEIKTLKLNQNFQNKYEKLVQMLSPYPHIINITEKGEIVLHGKRIPSSNFNDLFTNLFQHREKLNLEGEDEFLDVLKDLNIKDDQISSKEAKAKLGHSGSSTEPVSPTKFEDAPEGMSGEGRTHHRKKQHVTLSHKNPNRVTKSHHAKKSKSPHSAPPSTENKLGPPPGKRPRILRLYP